MRTYLAPLRPGPTAVVSVEHIRAKRGRKPGSREIPKFMVTTTCSSYTFLATLLFHGLTNHRHSDKLSTDTKRKLNIT